MYNSSFGMEFNPGNPTIDASPRESKVIFNSSLEKLAYEIEYEELGNLVDKSMTSIENKWNDIKINSFVLDMPIAYKVFNALPQRELILMNAVVDGKNSMSKDMELLAVLLPYDRGKLRHVIGNEDESGFNVRGGMMHFNLGGGFALFASGVSWMSSGVAAIVEGGCYSYTVFSGSNYPDYVSCGHAQCGLIVAFVKEMIQWESWDPGGRWLLLSSDIGQQLQHLVWRIEQVRWGQLCIA